MDLAPNALPGTATHSSTQRRVRHAPEPAYHYASASGIARRMDQLPLTRLHLAILAICACGFAFDLLEVTLGGALTAVFSAAPHRIAASQLSRLIAAIYVGAVVGAPLLGWLADRFGRKRALMAALVWLATTSIALALRDNVVWLTMTRLLAGLAIGAYPPLMFTYLTDVLPPRRRGMLILILSAVSTVGMPLGLLLLRWLTIFQPLGVEAWRWLFAISGLGAASAGVMLRFIPESPRWLMGIGRTAAAEAACQAFERSTVIRYIALAAAPAAIPAQDRANPGADPGVGWSRTLLSRYRSPLILAAILYFLSPWATVTFPLLSGPALIVKGVRLADTFTYLALATFGQLKGSVLAALFIDRIERRTAIVLCASLMALTALVFAANTAPIFLVGSSVAFGVFSGMLVPVLSVYVAELFPTRIRSSATSATWALNRIGAALAVLVLIPMLRGSGSIFVFDIMAGTLIAGVAIIMILGPPGLARRSVD
jgi:MFS transporter, putative metabolite:H+ symporter